MNNSKESLLSVCDGNWKIIKLPSQTCDGICWKWQLPSGFIVCIALMEGFPDGIFKYNRLPSQTNDGKWKNRRLPSHGAPGGQTACQLSGRREGKHPHNSRFPEENNSSQLPVCRERIPITPALSRRSIPIAIPNKEVRQSNPGPIAVPGYVGELWKRRCWLGWLV